MTENSNFFHMTKLQSYLKLDENCSCNSKILSVELFKKAFKTPGIFNQNVYERPRNSDKNYSIILTIPLNESNNFTYNFENNSVDQSDLTMFHYNEYKFELEILNDRTIRFYMKLCNETQNNCKLANFIFQNSKYVFNNHQTLNLNIFCLFFNFKQLNIKNSKFTHIFLIKCILYKKIQLQHLVD